MELLRHPGRINCTMPPLIRFLLKWTLIGTAAGGAFSVLLLAANVSGIGGMWLNSDQPLLWLLVFAVSFGVSFAQVTVLAAVLLRGDFGGKGESNDRLARWKAGGSAELDSDDAPLR